MSERDRALHVLRQSDRTLCRGGTRHIQSEKRLLQAGPYDEHIPFGVVESFHVEATGKVAASEGLVSATLAPDD